MEREESMEIRGGREEGKKQGKQAAGKEDMKAGKQEEKEGGTGKGHRKGGSWREREWRNRGRKKRSRTQGK